MDKSTDTPRIIKLPRIDDPRGNLTFLEDGRRVIPFDICRVYWTYDVPSDAERGGHAHRSCAEFIVAAAGKFTVNLFDGAVWHKYTLDNPAEGLFLPAGYWRTLDSYTKGSVTLALASEPFDENDYIRDFNEFLKHKNQ